MQNPVQRKLGGVLHQIHLILDFASVIAYSTIEMELTKTIAEKLGNVFINIGQGVVLGSLVSGLFGNEFRIAPLLAGLSVGVYTIYSGLVVLSQSKYMEE